MVFFVNFFRPNVWLHYISKVPLKQNGHGQEGPCTLHLMFQSNVQKFNSPSETTWQAILYCSILVLLYSILAEVKGGHLFSTKGSRNNSNIFANRFEHPRTTTVLLMRCLWSRLKFEAKAKIIKCPCTLCQKQYNPIMTEKCLLFL